MPSKSSAFKRAFAKSVAAVEAVLRDPNVDRAGKSLAAVLVVRGVIYFGASASVVELVQKAVSGF